MDVLPKVTLTQLAHFVAVADAGSFSEAALVLDVSQSTVSHNVLTLEHTLGARLFVRTRQGVRLTNAATEVITHARAALRHALAFEQGVRQPEGTLRGTVRVATIRSVATRLVPETIRDFKQTHPDVNVEVLLHEHAHGGIIGALQSGRADLGVVQLPTSDTLRVWPLLRDELMLVWPSELPKPVGWDDVTRHPLVIGEGPCGDVVRQHLAGLGLPWWPAHEVTEDSVLTSMVAHGLGVGILPRMAAEPLPVGAALHALPDRGFREVAAVALPNRPLGEVAAAFLHALQANARTSAGASDAPALTP
ncbi:LysR family transcriptional regulator [Deinococcus pimensis]|uniref:LysR family transcriptional regulator n=1 Tax=Deinococcus pimensis TaxID=309888 RepID=UPI0004B530F3|nr:LysR family transcriptional regulator [Deinococcus pimensis]